MKVAAIQMTSGPDVTANLEQARALLEDASARGARLAALPENFSFMGLKDSDKRAVAETDGSGPVQEFLAATARGLRLWIVGGTVPLRAGGAGPVRLPSEWTRDLRRQHDRGLLGTGLAARAARSRLRCGGGGAGASDGRAREFPGAAAPRLH